MRERKIQNIVLPLIRCLEKLNIGGLQKWSNATAPVCKVSTVLQCNLRLRLHILLLKSVKIFQNSTYNSYQPMIDQLWASLFWTEAHLTLRETQVLA